MTTCTVVEEPEGERVALRFHGDFDREGALKLQERVATLKRPLLLDFTQVHDFDDLAAAMLARLLVEDHAGRIALRGLCEQRCIPSRQATAPSGRARLPRRRLARQAASFR